MTEQGNLLEVFEDIARSLDLNRTADNILDGLTAVLDFDCATIAIEERAAGGLLCRVTKIEADDKERQSIVASKGMLRQVLADGRSQLQASVEGSTRSGDLRGATRSAVAAPLVGGGGRVLGAVLVESDRDGAFGPESLEDLVRYANAAAAAIERAQLYSQLIGGRRLEGELEVAGQVMAGFLPSEAPRLEGLDLAAVIEPSFEVGGDYYDFINLPNDRWGIAMADVSGKSVGAALLVAALRASLYLLARNEFALRAVFRRTNQFLFESAVGNGKYVTMFYAVLDPQARRLIYINAGHVPPVVVRAEGKVELLRSGGFPIGMFDNPRYFEHFLQLGEGDLLALYTDGITEAASSAQEDYGRDRLVQALQREKDKPANEICDAVLKDVRRFSGKAPTDDATILVIKAT